MISISDLSTQEIEILKCKFDSFVKELKRLIEITEDITINITMYIFSLFSE